MHHRPRNRVLVLIACGASLAACGARPQPDAVRQPSPAATPDEGERARALFEEAFEEQLRLMPYMATVIGDKRYNDRMANSIGPEWKAEMLATVRRYLDKLDAIDASKLGEQDRLSYDVLRQMLLHQLEGAQFPSELMPISQFFSIPNFIAQMGAGGHVQPFDTVADYDAWLGRVADFATWMDQAVVNMRQGVERGVVQPRVIMEKALPQLAAHVVDDVEKSAFYGPIARMPASFPEADRTRLDAAYRAAIRDTIIPAYKKVHDYIRDEYLPHARDTVGWSELPDGKAWYEYMTKTFTTIDIDADEVHELGLREVARIRGEMEKVMRQVGFSGSLAEWFEHCKTNDAFYYTDEAALLDGYRALQAKMDANVDRLFSIQPRAGFEIRPVEEFRAKSSAGASYLPPTPDGSRPGVFYVNTYNLRAQPKYDMESLYIHEAVPGHHFQIALQQELESLPRFRRFNNYSAYAEGWGLYAESLGKELGFYTDPMQWYGRLEHEMLRAMRLVVDTGLHAKGWTREQAIAYMQANSSMAKSDAVAEVERYIVIPGQALAYKIGQLTISRLRATAERQLGDRFDIRDFHTQILAHGALPLSVLDAKIDRWIAARR